MCFSAHFIELIVLCKEAEKLNKKMATCTKELTPLITQRQLKCVAISRKLDTVFINLKIFMSYFNGCDFDDE